MANYKLALDLGKKEYKEIEWNSVKKLPNNEVYKLKTLVDFTTEFKNELELKRYLLENNLITTYDYKKKICIIYNQSGTKKLMYGVSYNNAKKFFTTEYLMDQLIVNSTNLEFLEKLANHYRNTYGQNINVNEIYNYINDIRKGYDSYDRVNIIQTLEFLLRNEVFPYKKRKQTLKINTLTGEILKGDPSILRDKDNLEHKFDPRTGIVTYEKIINQRELDFRGLRDLAMFVVNFENNKNNEMNNDNSKKMEIFNEEKWEQPTLFDSLKKPEPKKWILSSEGDPDFPPNSEEEKWYNEYLENLPDEYHEDEETFKRR